VKIRVFTKFCWCLLAAVVGRPDLHAAVISYMPPEVIPISGSIFLGHTDFDINGDGRRDAVFLHSDQAGGIRTLNGNGVIASFYRPDMIEREIEPIPAGTFIGAQVFAPNLAWFRDSRPYEDGDYLSTATLGICVDTGCDGHFFGQTAYMGFELQLQDGPHYGWAKIQVSPEPNFSAGLLGWAWETEPGKSIIAGAVPESSSLSLAAFGAAAVSFRRRRGQL
jgi:hypothetical protein